MHPLHGEERTAIGLESDVVDRNDGRVLEASLHLRLPAEPRGGLGIVDMQAKHLFERDIAPDNGIMNQRDDAHAPLPQCRAGQVALGIAVLGCSGSRCRGSSVGNGRRSRWRGHGVGRTRRGHRRCSVSEKPGARCPGYTLGQTTEPDSTVRPRSPLGLGTLGTQK